MSKDDLTILGCFGLLAYIAVIVVIASVCGGLATSVLWQWFAVPMFELPSISIAQAIGLHLLVNSIVAKQIAKKTEEENIWVLCLHSALVAISPLLSIGFGWIVLQFT